MYENNFSAFYGATDLSNMAYITNNLLKSFILNITN